MPVPADISNPGFDVLGSPLDYSGRVRMNAALTASPCGTFNGTTEYVKILDHADFNITNNLSVFCRAKANTADLTASSMLIAKFDGVAGNYREWLFYLRDDEKFRLLVSSNGVGGTNTAQETNAAISVDNWHSYGATFSSGTFVLYVDGVVAPSTLIQAGGATSIFNGPEDIFVGANAAGVSGHFPGQICDVQVWKGTGAVFSAAQMLALHNGQTVTDPNQAQVLWLPIAEYSGTTTYDLGANTSARHNGTITAGTTTKGAGFWLNTQDAFHHVARYGGTLSGDVFVPGDPFNAGLDAAGNPLGLQPYKTHEPNLIDFTNGVLAPGTATWETAYVFDSSRTNPLFVRDIKSGGATVASDRLLAYGTALAGDDLTDANEYTADA